MPIRPENKKYYTAKSGWPLIRACVLFQAANCCEWEMPDGTPCGAPNGAAIQWDGEKWRELTRGECDAATADGEKVVIIVLTIAHLNQDPTDNRRANLKALCQRHHNRLDAPHRASGIRKRRHEKAGQQKLI